MKPDNVASDSAVKINELSCSPRSSLPRWSLSPCFSFPTSRSKPLSPTNLSTRYEGLQRSYTRDGYPSLGDPDAPVTLEEYASFACPGCEAFHSDSFDDVLTRAKDLQVLFTYVPLQTGSVPNASGASRAALCAGEQGMFWEMHDVLFEWHTRYGNTAFSQNRLLAGVEQLGMDSAAFTACFNSADISATLTAAMNEDVSSTPSFRVNGVTLESGGAIPTVRNHLAGHRRCHSGRLGN